MKKISLLASILFVLCACNNHKTHYDATGTFDATETVVYAEQNGKLLNFIVKEGNCYEKGTKVGLIDTMHLYLSKNQLEAQRQVFLSQRPDMEKQLAATKQQLEKAIVEQQRQHDLLKDGATSSKMADDADSQVKVLQKQLEAQTSALKTQLNTLNAQAQTTQAQIQVINEQLSKCRVVNPITGTVLEKYVEQSEFVAAGKPLYKIADTENIRLKAYFTSTQLEKIQLGQKVKVFADFGGQNKREYEGTITWISARSEFTPKTILTDDERADLVYAVKIDLKNDGYVKIGMYGEVKL